MSLYFCKPSPFFNGLFLILRKIFVFYAICHIFIELFFYKRGSSGEKVSAFRDSYGDLAQLRSLLSSKTPFVASTATATRETFEFIRNSLLFDQFQESFNATKGKQHKYSVIS